MTVTLLHTKKSISFPECACFMILIRDVQCELFTGSLL